MRSKITEPGLKISKPDPICKNTQTSFILLYQSTKSKIFDTNSNGTYLNRYPNLRATTLIHNKLFC